MKIEITVSDMDEFNSLVMLLCEHIESLPKPVVDALEAMADGVGVVDIKYLESRLINPADCTIYDENGEKIHRAASLNLIKREVNVCDSNGNIVPIRPKSARLKCGDKVIAGW